ncbi:MAG: cell envelope integrity EipB family protein [Alphaproteobacteria bacterium]|nr:cell envelope integrity EipB family protein [Alphaproteobacteria bacterium]
MMFRRFLVSALVVFLLPPASMAAGIAAAVQTPERLVKAGWFQAAPDEPQAAADNKPATGPETGQAPVVVSIAPHRAVYKMALASVKNGSNITGVTGRMLFEWADDCEGWAVQQRLQLHFNYAEGDEADVNSTVLSWEAKNGKRYNFNVRRKTNGKEIESYRGRALMGEQDGSAKYSIPKDKKDVVLAQGTLFPSAHTELILEKAAAGEMLFTRRVFDGSDEEGQADVSAFMGARRDHSPAAEANPELKDNPLLAKPAWPVRLAFYKPDTETGEPDYEMNVELQSNGIARSMLIDYGDFAVSGVLNNLEALPVSSCKH